MSKQASKQASKSGASDVVPWLRWRTRVPLVIGAALLMAPRQPTGGCGASGRYVELGADGDEPTRLILGAESSFQYGSVSLPSEVDTLEWQGDNFSRLLLIGADPAVTPFPPLEPLVAGSGPSTETEFTRALEVAWPLRGLDGPMNLSETIRGQFPDGIQAIRSVDVGACSLPIPWIVDPNRLDLVPRGWATINAVLSDNFRDENGTPLGLAQFILREMDGIAAAEEGARWRLRRTTRVNISVIRPTDAPGAQMFWYKMGESLLGSESDEFCISSNYNVRANVTLLGVIPLTIACYERLSIRFCGRFDAVDVTSETPAGTRFTMTSAEVERTPRASVCGEVMKVVAANFADVLENDLEDIVSDEFNDAFSDQSLTAVRFEHTPSRLEVVLLDDEDAEPPGRIAFAGLCRDAPLWRGDVPVIPTVLGDGNFVR